MSACQHFFARCENGFAHCAAGRWRQQRRRRQRRQRLIQLHSLANPFVHCGFQSMRYYWPPPPPTRWQKKEEEKKEKLIISFLYYYHRAKLSASFFSLSTASSWVCRPSRESFNCALRHLFIRSQRKGREREDGNKSKSIF